MAIDTGPYRIERSDLDETLRPTAHSAWLSVIVLTVGVALATWYILLADRPAPKFATASAQKAASTAQGGSTSGGPR